MFTGIVEEIGKIKNIERKQASMRLFIHAEKIMDDVKIGDSIAVNGICLTVTEYQKDWFSVDVMPETMRKTSLSLLRNNGPVNLERAVRLTDRLGGHIVSGHIDGVGRIISRRQEGNAWLITIQTAADILHYIVEKSSIAIDGISLTVVKLVGNAFTVSLIPHTTAVTSLGSKKIGDIVNLENDVIGKYVEKLVGKRIDSFNL